MHTDHNANQASMGSSSSQTDERFERVVQVSEPVSMTARSFVPWLFGGLLALLALVLFCVTILDKVKSQNRVTELTAENTAITGQLGKAEADLRAEVARVAEINQKIKTLEGQLSFEKEARALDRKALDEAAKQKKDIDAIIAARDKAAGDLARAEGERDAARKVSLEVVASKQALEEQVSVLQKRLDDALARITDLEDQIRKALAERDEMQDMLRVCQSKQSQAAPTPQATMLAQAAQVGRAMSNATTSPVDLIPPTAAQPTATIRSTRSGEELAEGLSAPATATSINTPPLGPGAVTNVLLLPGDESDGNQNIVRQVNDLTISREESRKRTEVLEDEVSRLRAEMLKARSNKPATASIKLAPSERLRPTSIGNNYTQKEVGLVGFVPDAIGNIFVGIGEGLDSLFNGTHYVPRELLQGGDAHSN